MVALVQHIALQVVDAGAEVADDAVGQRVAAGGAGSGLLGQRRCGAQHGQEKGDRCFHRLLFFEVEVTHARHG
jgi:hypothetical protein